MALKKKKPVTIKEEAPEETTPEIVEKKSEVKEWCYDELVLLSREDFLKVQADVKAGKAKFKQQ